MDTLLYNRSPVASTAGMKCSAPLHRSLFGNVASLVMSGSDSCSSSSVRSDVADTIMGVESMEGEVLELSNPVSTILIVCAL